MGVASGPGNFSWEVGNYASGPTSSSSDLPPAPKRTKRASKRQEEWKKYNMKQSERGGFICLL